MRELGREPEPHLLVLEERDRPGHRLAQHEHDPRPLEHRGARPRHRGATVEVRGRRLQSDRPVRLGREVPVPHARGRQRLAVAGGQEVAASP